MNVYVASSWRNPTQQLVVELLRADGFEVYDFKRPGTAFHWRDVDPGFEHWTFDEYRAGLEHELSGHGFEADFGAMQVADACVLVLPCGRSAHLEAGWFAGQDKFLAIYQPGAEPFEPELMYKMATVVTNSFQEVRTRLEAYRRTTVAA